MSMDNINISFDQVSAAAQSIDSLNQNLTLKLNEMKQEINALQSSWDSAAGDTLQMKINNFATRFDEYKEIIQKYVIFLNDTVTEYTATETNLNKYVGDFK